MKNKIAIAYGFFAFLIWSFLAGCNSEKKIKKDYDAYRADHLELFAGDCAAAFPQLPGELLPGKVIHRIDTQYLDGPRIECPPAEPGKAVYVDCPPHQRIHDSTFIHDTLKVPDPFKVQEYRLAADRMQQEAATATAKLTSVENDMDKWRKRGLTLTGICLGLLFLLGVSAYFHLKP